jgi:hypothetical protein
MSVAQCLGVNDVDGPQMREVRLRWSQWCEVEPALGIVEDLVALPTVMRRLEPNRRDDVLAALVRLGVVETEATIALIWLLVPGAAALARRLGDLSADIDELVAGQLWIQARQHRPDDSRYVAVRILKATERELKWELGIGDLAKRRDPAWANVVLTKRFHESKPVHAPADEDAAEHLDDVLRRALDAGALTDADRDLLVDLAHAAHRMGAPWRRGRGGLTTPSVAQMVSEDHALAARTVRRHAAAALDRISGLAW